MVQPCKQSLTLLQKKLPLWKHRFRELKHSKVIKSLKMCLKESKTSLVSTNDTVNLLTYVNKIKTRMKSQPTIIDFLERNLQASIQHSNSTVPHSVKTFQLKAFMCFLKLYIIVKLCKDSSPYPKFTIHAQNQKPSTQNIPQSFCFPGPQFDSTINKMLKLYKNSLRTYFNSSKCSLAGLQSRILKNNTDEDFSSTLISNFIAQTLPDLTNPHKSWIPLPLNTLPLKMGSDSSYTHKPVWQIFSNTHNINWKQQTSTDLYSVFLPSSDSLLGPLTTTPYPPIDSWTYLSSVSWHPVAISHHTPTSLSPLLTSSNHEEPAFIEPLVVSSVDKLPTKYHTPIENVSLNHNPLAVKVGGRPPEILIVQDVSVPAVDMAPDASSAGALNSEAPVQLQHDATVGAAPAAGAASIIGPLAAAAAGVGSLAAAGLVGGAVGAGVGAGSAVAITAGAASGVLAAGDSTAESSAGISTAVAASSGSQYSPEPEDDLDDPLSDIYDLMELVTSFRIVRIVIRGFYNLVLPHLSFLVTSGFAVVAFFFPWLYPHIVLPVLSYLVSLTNR